MGFTLLLIAAGGSWYLARTLNHQEAVDNDGNVGHQGFYVRSARILGTNESGDLLYEIEAEYAEQQADDKIEFRNVEINYTTKAAVPWTLKADKALIGDDREVLSLSGHVVAVSNDGFSGHVTEIRTPHLELEPDTFRAETDARVQIRIGTRSITATGMLALLQTSQLQLKSNVSGKFVP